MTILPLSIIKNQNCIITFADISFNILSIPEGVYTISSLSNNSVVTSIEIRIKNTPSVSKAITRNYANINVVNIVFDVITTIAVDDYIIIPISINYVNLNRQSDYVVKLDTTAKVLPFVTTDESLLQIDLLRKGSSVLIKTVSTVPNSIELAAYINYKFEPILTTPVIALDSTMHEIILTKNLIYKLKFTFDDIVEERYVINYMGCYNSLIRYISKLDINQLDKIFEMNKYSIIINKFLYLHKLDSELQNMEINKFLDILPDLSSVLQELANYVTELDTATDTQITDVEISTNVIPKFSI